MDSTTAAQIAHVTRVHQDASGAWVVTLKVPAGTTIGPVGPSPSDYVDALWYLGTDWSALTAKQLTIDLVKRWANWVQVVTAPAPSFPDHIAVVRAGSDAVHYFWNDTTPGWQTTVAWNPSPLVNPPPAGDPTVVI